MTPTSSDSDNLRADIMTVRVPNCAFAVKRLRSNACSTLYWQSHLSRIPLIQGARFSVARLCYVCAQNKESNACQCHVMVGSSVQHNHQIFVFIPHTLFTFPSS